MTALSLQNITLLSVTSLNDAQALDGLLCLWDSDASVLEKSRTFMAKALLQLQAGFDAPAVVWVTRRAVGAGPEDSAAGLGAGPLWGLARKARGENLELRLRLVDVHEGVDRLSAAIMLDAEPECAVRKGQVLLSRLQRVLVEPRRED